MISTRTIRVLAALASTILLTSAFAATKADLESALSHDGLKQINVKDLELVYARPGATLTGYGQFMLDPIYVAFRKDWNPTRPGSNIKLGSGDREAIRTKVGKLVGEEFVKELQGKGNYKIATAAGPDVLRVKVSVVNLYVNSPDTGSAGVLTGTVSAGDMTLYLELFDSETGEVLARVVDRRAGRSAGDRLTISNRVENAAQAQEIASGWARILRNALDKARGIGKK